MTDYNNSGKPCDNVSALKEKALRLIMELTDEQCEEIWRELHVKGIIK